MSKDRMQLIKTVKHNISYDDTRIIKILKNEETGEKVCDIINEPVKKFYITKPEKWLDKPVSYLPLDDVYPIVCPEHEVLRTIAYSIGEEKQFWKNIENKQYKLNDTLHLDPNVHGSDMNIEDLYIEEHFEEYPLSESDGLISKSYLDIETDIRNIDGFPDPEDAEAPVNLITYYDDITNICIALILKDEDNKQMMDFYNDEDKQKEFRKEMMDFYKDEHDISLNNIQLFWFDEEINLIRSIFKIINGVKPDFNMGWNTTNFDYPYLMNRISVLGYDPKEIICSPEIPYKTLFLYDDTYNDSVTDKNSYFQVSSFTVYLDQLLLYANIRKPMGRKDSYALDDIGEEEVGVNKVEIDPDNEGINIKNLVEKDFIRFLKYGIQDTMLLMMIEEKNRDVDLLNHIASLTRTRIHHALKKTISLKNKYRSFCKLGNSIMSNNHNTNWANMNSGEREKIEGAFVGDPNLNDNVGIEIIDGIRSKFIHDNVADKDFSALYPNIRLIFNIGPETMVGRIETYDEENEERLEHITRSNELNRRAVSLLMDDLISQDYVYIGNKYLGLKNVTEVLSDPRVEKIIDKTVS